MFVSLNKKFIYTIAFFFLFTAVLFIYTFYIIYGIRFQEELKSNISRNQQYLELLYENNTLRKEVHQLAVKNPNLKITDYLKKEILTKKEDESLQSIINREKKHTEELMKNYDDRYSTIMEGTRIVAVSSILIIMAIGLLWFLIRRWILAPLDELSNVSEHVAEGNLSSRVKINKRHIFLDEIDILSDTFNNMLENLENSMQEIKEKENFLQSLIDGIPDGLRVIDKDYNIIIANKEYYKQIGKNRKRSKCYEASQNLYEPCSNTMFSCPMHEICKNNKTNVRVVQQFVNHPNRHLSINAAPLKLNDKLFVVEVIRDLSDDIKFSHQQKLSSLGFMTTSIAHEMKNHLGSIRMITERLLEKFFQNKDNNSEEKKLLTLIYNQLVECINVPERLLKLSKISNDEFQDINCLDNIKDVVALLDYEAKHNGIIIESTPQQSNITIKGSEADFKMMIVNLILNAIKAIKTNGIIKIELTTSGKNAIIKIIDNGSGISKDKLPRIFEPFYSDGKDSRLGGTGLGLSIVKSIVEKFKGSVTVNSKIDVGTEFTLKFPRVDKK